MNISLRAAAQTEFTDLIAWIERRDSAASIKVEQAVYGTLDLLAPNPESGDVIE